MRLFWGPLHQESVSLPPQENPLHLVDWSLLWPILSDRKGWQQHTPLDYIYPTALAVIRPPASSLVDLDLARAAIRRIIIGWHTCSLARKNPWIYVGWSDDACRHPMLPVPLMRVSVILGTGIMHPFTQEVAPSWAHGLVIQPTVHDHNIKHTVYSRAKETIAGDTLYRAVYNTTMSLHWLENPRHCLPDSHRQEVVWDICTDENLYGLQQTFEDDVFYYRHSVDEGFLNSSLKPNIVTTPVGPNTRYRMLSAVLPWVVDRLVSYPEAYHMCTEFLTGPVVTQARDPLLQRVMVVWQTPCPDQVALSICVFQRLQSILPSRATRRTPTWWDRGVNSQGVYTLREQSPNSVYRKAQHVLKIM